MVRTATVFPSSSHSWRASYVIYLLSIDLDHPFVDHAGCYLRVCPIWCLLQLAVSCSKTRWYCSEVISSLMRPDCQLWAFNAEMTASLGIAPPPRPHSWPTVLVFLFGTSGEAVFEGMPFSPSVTSVHWGQGCPRQCLLAAWTFFVHLQTFLFPRRGPWAWYEMSRGCHILWPHKYHLVFGTSITFSWNFDIVSYTSFHNKFTIWCFSRYWMILNLGSFLLEMGKLLWIRGRHKTIRPKGTLEI